MRPRIARLGRLLCLVVVCAAGPSSPTAVAPATRPKPAGPAGGTLPWPIQRTPAIVSTFGEYRYDHLHAGIDVSTGGSIGVPVHAVADGAVYRLKVEWRGYGRALYLRHDRGDVSVYGHLDSYEEKTLHLESRVRRRRAEGGTRWPGDILLEPPIRVRKGQVIAYTGESGVGPPHLHFELRGAQDDPIDPFRSGMTPPANRNAPVFESLLLTAATGDVLIDGGWRERSVPLARRGGFFEPPAPIVVDGPVRATLSAWDPIGDGRAGLASVRMAVDGAECLTIEVARFRFDQYPVAGLLFDHRLSRMGPMRMGFRLARLPGNVFAAGGCGMTGAPPGSIDLPPGEHQIEVTARDAAGMESRARLTIRRVEPGAAPDEPALAAGSDGGRGQAGATLPAPRYFPGFFELAIPAGGEPPALDRCPAPFADRTWRRLEGEGLKALALDYREGAALAASLERGEVDAACPLAAALAGTGIDWVRREEAARRESGAVRVDIPAGGRFFAGPLVTRDAGAPDPPAGLRAAGASIELLPAGEALDARGSLAFRIDAVAGDARRLGIYRYDGSSKRWGYEGGEIEAALATMSIPFRRYGRFALLADESAPDIVEVRPRGGVVGRRPALSARVSETGKGLDWDGVRFTVDGQAVATEFDPDRATARPIETPALEPGRHRLVVTAIDRAGNEAVPVTVEFVVR